MMFFPCPLSRWDPRFPVFRMGLVMMNLGLHLRFAFAGIGIHAICLIKLVVCEEILRTVRSALDEYSPVSANWR